MISCVAIPSCSFIGAFIKASRSAHTTFAPSLAYLKAIALPRPDEDPVTMATLPARRPEVDVGLGSVEAFIVDIDWRGEVQGGPCMATACLRRPQLTEGCRRAWADFAKYLSVP